jgi:hypothetical protein
MGGSMDALLESPATLAEAKTENSWQSKLLPFMLAVLLILTVFCCVANLYQVHVVQEHIQQAHEVDLAPAFAILKATANDTAADRLAFARWQSLATLESSALESRYHEAGLMLMTRIYIVFLGFTTGMVLALVGATFILGKLREPASTVDAQGAKGKISFASTSPGLMLAFFGMVLMLATIFARTEVSVTDKSLYTSGPMGLSTQEATVVGTPARAEAARSVPTNGQPAQSGGSAADAAKEKQKNILQHVTDVQKSTQ